MCAKFWFSTIIYAKVRANISFSTSKRLSLRPSTTWRISFHIFAPTRENAYFCIQLVQKKVVGENGERRLRDRTELWLPYLISQLAFTLHENEYTNYERLSEGSCLRRQKKRTLFSVERRSSFPRNNGLLSPTLLASHKKFRNIALHCSFRMKPLQLNAEEHGQTI